MFFLKEIGASFAALVLLASTAFGAQRVGTIELELDGKVVKAPLMVESIQHKTGEFPTYDLLMLPYAVVKGKAVYISMDQASLRQICIAAHLKSSGYVPVTADSLSESKVAMKWERGGFVFPSSSPYYTYQVICTDNSGPHGHVNGCEGCSDNAHGGDT